jgi:hypothetical protein
MRCPRLRNYRIKRIPRKQGWLITALVSAFVCRVAGGVVIAYLEYVILINPLRLIPTFGPGSLANS